MLHTACDHLLKVFVSGASILGCAIDDKQDYSFYCLRGKENDF